jgi:hypothetical protein
LPPVVHHDDDDGDCIHTHTHTHTHTHNAHTHSHTHRGLLSRAGSLMPTPAPLAMAPPRFAFSKVVSIVALYCKCTRY